MLVLFFSDREKNGHFRGKKGVKSGYFMDLGIKLGQNAWINSL